MTTKITAVNWDIFFYLSAFNSSWYEEQFLRYKQIFDEKLPLVKILENKLFRHRPEAIGRPVIHTRHIHMNENTFFWMLRAQTMRICNVEMKIWGFTPTSDAFSKWLSWRKCKKPRNFLISTSNYYRYTQFSRYMFLRMTNTVLLVKYSLHIEKDFKSHDGRQFWPTKPLSVWNILICQSQYCLKQKVLKFCVFIANYGVNNEKPEIYGLRQLLSIIDLYYSTPNNDVIHYQ